MALLLRPNRIEGIRRALVVVLRADPARRAGRIGNAHFVQSPVQRSRRKTLHRRQIEALQVELGIEDQPLVVRFRGVGVHAAEAPARSRPR